MGLDDRILRACARLRSPRRDRAVAGFSRLGNYGACWLAAGGALAMQRRSPRPFQTTAVVVWGTLGANYAVKRLVRRGRPQEDAEASALIRAPRSHSFPSAHAAMSAAAAVHLGRLQPRLAPSLAVAAAAMAASRAYLAVHHPSDVAAGVALGLGTGRGLSAALRAYAPAHARADPRSRP